MSSPLSSKRLASDDGKRDQSPAKRFAPERDTFEYTDDTFDSTGTTPVSSLSATHLNGAYQSSCAAVSELPTHHQHENDTFIASAHSHLTLEMNSLLHGSPILSELTSISTTTTTGRNPMLRSAALLSDGLGSISPSDIFIKTDTRLETSSESEVDVDGTSSDATSETSEPTSSITYAEEHCHTSHTYTFRQYHEEDEDEEDEEEEELEEEEEEEEEQEEEVDDRGSHLASSDVDDDPPAFDYRLHNTSRLNQSVKRDNDDDDDDDDETYSDDEHDPFEKLVGSMMCPKVDLSKPSFEAFTEQERQALHAETREIGMHQFIERYVYTGKFPLPKLIDLFGYRISPEIESLSEEQLFKLFCISIQRFLSQRKKRQDINTLDDAVNLIRNAKNIIVLTGAGVSVSCGIPDFRSANGIYSRMGQYELDDPQQMFDIHFFRACPEIFFSFAKEIYPSNFKPSPSHAFIRLLEQRGQLLRNYTQNIDTLEQAAGIQRVLQCHGSFATASCIQCHYQVPGHMIEKDILSQRVPFCPRCTQEKKSRRQSNDDPSDDDDDMSHSKAIMKPDIVFFGEALPSAFDKCLAEDRNKVDLLIVMGTSLKVAPVSGIMGHIPHSVPQIVINKTPIRHMEFDIQLLGDCDVIVPELCRRLGWRLEHEKLVGGHSDHLKEGEPFHFISPNVYLFKGAVLDEEDEYDGDDDDDDDETEDAEEKVDHPTTLSSSSTSIDTSNT